MLPALAQALEDPRPMTDAEQRLACFEMFNTYWQDASDRGIPFDTIGTMSISAALFAQLRHDGQEPGESGGSGLVVLLIKHLHGLHF